MEIKTKSKLDEFILCHLTPEGDLLDLEDKNVTPEHLRLLSQAGETLRNVKQLYLSNNGLGNSEVEFLSKGFNLVSGGTDTHLILIDLTE